MSKPLTIDSPESELIMWDAGTGTAYMLARGHAPLMSSRTKAITKALLQLALDEIEQEET